MQPRTIIRTSNAMRLENLTRKIEQDFDEVKIFSQINTFMNNENYLCSLMTRQKKIISKGGKYYCVFSEQDKASISYVIRLSEREKFVDSETLIFLLV